MEQTQKPRFYTFTFHIETLQVRDGRTGPYAEIGVTYVPSAGPNRNTVVTAVALCGGAAYEDLRDDLVVGGEIRIYGQFLPSREPGETQKFRIAGRSKSQDQARASTEPSVTINGHRVPTSQYAALQELWTRCPAVHAALTEPLGPALSTTAEQPHVIANRAVPFEEHRAFMLLLSRSPDLRRALQG